MTLLCRYESCKSPHYWHTCVNSHNPIRGYKKRMWLDLKSCLSNKDEVNRLFSNHDQHEVIKIIIIILVLHPFFTRSWTTWNFKQLLSPCFADFFCVIPRFRTVYQQHMVLIQPVLLCLLSTQSSNAMGASERIQEIWLRWTEIHIIVCVRHPVKLSGLSRREQMTRSASCYRFLCHSNHDTVFVSIGCFHSFFNSFFCFTSGIHEGFYIFILRGTFHSDRSV